MSEPEDRTEDASVSTEGEQTQTPAAAPVETEAVVETTPVVEEEVVEVPAEESVEEVVEESASTEVPATTEATEGAPVEVVAAASPMTALVAKWQSKKMLYNIVAAVAVVLLLVGLTYFMEQQGRLNTGLFDGVNKMIAMKKTVAKVNGVAITQFDLDISVSQISAGAQLQGVDTEDPKMKSEITNQAIDMLVNTELLKQEAAAREIVITDEDVDARLETLKTDVGGEEVLKERMEQFNIDDKTLRRDIKNELTIQTLLDAVFAEKDLTVTEADISAFYAQAGGTEAGLPPLADVSEQIAAQLKTTKEQEVVTAFVKELRDKAAVEVLL